MDAMAQTETGAKLLIEGRVSMRDAADILGISSGRVQQLVTGDACSRRKRRSRRRHTYHHDHRYEEGSDKDGDGAHRLDEGRR